ncbi:MAG: tRNA pseudouridine(38-40) synthase TruA [bacterium]
MDVRNIRLKIAYDGTGFAGWQTQPGLPTIQESIEIAIEKMTGQRPKLIGSGRTDAGVHAHAQVATFYTAVSYSPAKFQNAINAFLPQEIRIIAADEVPVAFHPTLDVISKRYRYRIDNSRTADPLKLRFAHHIPQPLDAENMRRGAAFLIGRHDFAAFQTVGSERLSTVRTIFACDVFRLADEIHVEVEADGFLYNMVRAIAGTLILVGSGKWPPELVAEIVASADRRKAGPTAPAKGLAMLWVRYENEFC